MEASEPRIVYDCEYPKLPYLESLVFFLGGNLIFHQAVFRHRQNKLQFTGFLLVNLFTSYQLGQACNHGVIKYYAALFNNSKELQHRALITQQLRLKLFKQQ